jgi:hypothetical protein
MSVLDMQVTGVELIHYVLIKINFLYFAHSFQKTFSLHLGYILSSGNTWQLTCNKISLQNYYFSHLLSSLLYVTWVKKT